MLTVDEHLLDHLTETIYRVLKGEKLPPVDLPERGAALFLRRNPHAAKILAEAL